MNDLQLELIRYGRDLLRSRLLEPFRGWPERLQGLSEAVGRAVDILESTSPSEDPHLHTIFSKLRPYGTATSHFPLAVLTTNVLTETDQNPHDIWSEFDAKVNSLGNGTGYFGTFCYLMIQFGSRANAGMRHVSAADHWRLVSALAHSFDRDPTGEVLLVSNDFSGLYDFLKLVATRGAAKGFRGRSYFFQILAQILARCILREFSLPLCNMLFEAASKFYLLLPRVVEAELVKLRRVITERLLQLHGGDIIPQFGYVRLRGEDLFNRDRYMHAASELHRVMQERAEQALSDLSPERLGTFFEPIGLGTELYCEACRTDLLEGEGFSLEDQDVGADEEVRGKKLCSQCHSFGRTGPGRGLAQELARSTRVLIRNKANSRRLVDLGWDDAVRMVKALSDEAAHSGWFPGSPTNRPTWQECVGYLGYEYSLFGSEVGSSMTQETGDEHLTLNPEAAEWLPGDPNPDVSYGFRWVGQTTPIEDKSIVDTTRMAELAVPKDGPFVNRGVERYALLYADGDGMGEAYEACESILELVGLSSTQALFFEGWLNHLCRKAKENALGTTHSQLDAYLLYAGGDDILAVGTWQVVLELARLIRCHYGQYVRAGIVNLNDDSYAPSPFTISGGVVLVPQRFPLYQAVRMSEEATHRSKHIGERLREHRLSREARGDNSDEIHYPVKDCITALGVTLPWEQFWEAKNFAATLSGLLVGGTETKPLNRSIIRRFEDIIRAHESAKLAAEVRSGVSVEPHDWVIGPWMAMARYTLSRAFDAFEGDRKGTTASFLDLLQFNILKQQSGGRLQVINWMALPVRWAELLTRGRTTK